MNRVIVVACILLVGVVTAVLLPVGWLEAWPGSCKGPYVNNVSVTSVCYAGDSGDGFRTVARLSRNGYVKQVYGPWRTPGNQSIVFTGGWHVTSSWIQKIDCCMTSV